MVVLRIEERDLIKFNTRSRQGFWDGFSRRRAKRLVDLGSAWLWLTPMCEPVYPSQHKPQSLQLPLSGSRTTQGTSIHRERVRSDVHGHFRSLQSTAHNPQARKQLSNTSRSKSLVLRTPEPDDQQEE